MRYNEENVLNGWDYQLSSQIPYLHWASAFINEYQIGMVFLEMILEEKKWDLRCCLLQT